MSAVLSMVYNNLLSTYTPKPVTRYDAHKKSELRDVYNSIVKLNKDAPWYLPTTSMAAQHYAIDLKENARALHNTIARLGGLEEDGLFSKKSAYSSEPEIVSASYIGPQRPENPSPGLQLIVRSVASSQENLGFFMPESEVELPPGTYSFDIDINDINYKYQFSVAEGDSNLEVQKRLMRLLNNSSIGLRADVIESEGSTSLRLTSEATGLPEGKERLFTVNDTYTGENVSPVRYFGLDYVSRQATNADIVVNGEEHVNSSNHFTIGKMFEIELKSISPDDRPVQIGLKTDVESLADNVTHLIGGYNEFVKAASSYLSTQSRSRQLVQELKGIALVYGTPLGSMGLTMSQDGTLNVDDELLRRTAKQTQDIPKTFGYLKNFSDMLLRKSNQISLNPMDYVERTMVAYKNPGHNFVSPYSTSAYSGMLFNGYC